MVLLDAVARLPGNFRLILTGIHPIKPVQKVALRES